MIGDTHPTWDDQPLAEQHPVILDSATRQEPIEPDIRVHEEHFTEDEKLRHRKREPHEPEIRLRHAPTAREFDKIKRGNS